MLNEPIPDRGVILGGSLALHGNSVSLACFHGVNFRAQTWVLFNLKHLYSEFVSRVRGEEKSCYIRRVRAVQTLMIKLGYEDDDNVPGNMSPSMSKWNIVCLFLFMIKIGSWSETQCVRRGSVSVVA